MVKPKKDDFWSEVHAQRINQDQRLRYHLVCLQWGFVDIRQLASNPVKNSLITKISSTHQLTFR